MLKNSLSITLLVSIRAGKANKANRETAEQFEIWNKSIAPRETLTGLILIPGNSYVPLTFSYGHQVSRID